MQVRAPRTSAIAYPASLGVGVALWGATSLLSGRAEAWDAPVFWRVAYPAAIVASGLLGLIFPERAWRWAVCVFVAQLLVMIALGSDFSLLPLGLALTAVLAAPAVGVSLLAERLRARR